MENNIEDIIKFIFINEDCWNPCCWNTIDDITEGIRKKFKDKESE